MSRLRYPIVLGVLLLFSLAVCPSQTCLSQTIWIEGEDANSQSMQPHGWYDSINRDQLSGNDYLSNFGPKKGTAQYEIQVPQAGQYDLWVRANHVASQLQYRIDSQTWQEVDTSSPQQAINLAADGKPDLRFLSWNHAGTVELPEGRATLAFQMVSQNNNHGSLDCFVLSRDGFTPNGKWKPGVRPDVSAAPGWFVFYPPVDRFDESSVIDLRSLNQASAGQDGRVIARDGKFYFSETQQPVRFWAVNGPPHNLTGNALKRTARRLAKYGVNLVRVHHRVFTPQGEPDPDYVRHCHEVVQAMKAEGIYVHFSIYFPLWFQPQPQTPWLKGYDGNQHPFAALYFNPQFQQQYQKWMDALLLTPDAAGHRLIDDPAVFGLELINEDSLFFWTFSPERIPAQQFQLIEQQFYQWVLRKYESLDAAYQSWNSQPIERDSTDQQRLAIRPLWNIANQRTPRDQDTATFLAEVQYRFYQRFEKHLDDIGFQGLVTCSNWHTASPEFLDPLERLSYTAGDFMDRHGYFSGLHQGEASSYSIRQQHIYTDRSALRFDPAEPGKPKDFSHPAMDLHYNSMPSMISETTFNRPNRYRSEGPLVFAALGAVQDSDAIVHFAYDGDQWSVQSGGINPWSLSTPAMLAQFPAAALIYRQGLIETPSQPALQLTMNLDDLKSLKGTAFPQGASYDQLRAADLPENGVVESGSQRLDPLLHLVGPTKLTFSSQPTAIRVSPEARECILRDRSLVRSANQQLALNYELGVLTVNSPLAQGVSGNLAQAGGVQLQDIRIESDRDLMHVILVSLDGNPISTSSRMLLQVMSEERPTGRETTALADGRLQITQLGTDPWQVREFQGHVSLPGGNTYQVQPLDALGYPAGDVKKLSEIPLEAETLYYLILP